MSTPVFNAKLTVTAVEEIAAPNDWFLTIDVIDGEGIFYATDIQPNDLVFLDTSLSYPSTISRFKVVDILPDVTPATATLIITYDDDLDPAYIDMYSLLPDGLVCRPTYYERFSTTGDSNVQNLPTKFVTYLRNTDFKTIDTLFQAGGFGATGIQGSTGTQGVTGPAGGGGSGDGSTGVQGVTGIAGIQGFTGVQGTTGVGLQGIQGVTGPSGGGSGEGATGVQGTTGLAGATGPGTSIQYITRNKITNTVHVGTSIDSVPVINGPEGVEWTVVVKETAAPQNVYMTKINAVHNGYTGLAGQADYSEYGIQSIGTLSPTISVGVTGSDMCLFLTTSSSCVGAVVRISIDPEY